MSCRLDLLIAGCVDHDSHVIPFRSGEAFPRRRKLRTELTTPISSAHRGLVDEHYVTSVGLFEEPGHGGAIEIVTAACTCVPAPAALAATHDGTTHSTGRLRRCQVVFAGLEIR